MGKPKTSQPKTEGRQERDFFQTPPYAVDLLLPFIPLEARAGGIWECAAGDGMLANRLRYHGYAVIESDVEPGERRDCVRINFLGCEPKHSFGAIITNPPYSLKREFAERCMELGRPWALLIPADICQWICAAFEDWGCHAIVPRRRIDYITPDGKRGKDSQAQFHSWWLTWRFCATDRLTIVDLTNEMKRGEDIEDLL
jgi:hypothetical protein